MHVPPPSCITSNTRTCTDQIADNVALKFAHSLSSFEGVREPDGVTDVLSQTVKNTGNFGWIDPNFDHPASAAYEHSLPCLHLPLLTSVHSGHPMLPPTPPTTTTATVSPHLPIPSPLFLPPSLSRYRVPVRRASIGKTINRYFYASLCPEFAPLLQVHKYTHTPPPNPLRRMGRTKN